MSITPAKIELCLSKNTNSFLENLTLYEYVNIGLIKQIINSSELLTSWDRNTYTVERISELYSNEKEHLTSYISKYNKNMGVVPVKYIKPKHKWGRVFAYKGLGLNCFRKAIRNTIVNGLYNDYDLSNAHPTIILNICKTNNIDCSSMEDYVNNQAVYLQQIQDKYNVNKSTAKSLVLRLCFFGTFLGWRLANDIKITEQLEFIINISTELIGIALEIKKHNSALYETARKSKENKVAIKKENILGSFFALYLQEYELRIVETVIKWLHTETEILNHGNLKVCNYEYDGIKILKDKVEFYGEDKLVSDIERVTLERTGFNLKWVKKEITGFIPFEDYVFEPYINKVATLSTEIDPELKEFGYFIDNFMIGKMINEKRLACYIRDNEKYKGKFLYCLKSKSWYEWNDKKNKWELSNSRLKHIIDTEIETDLNNRLKDFEIYEEGDEECPNLKLLNDIKNRILNYRVNIETSHDRLEQIVKYCKDKLERDDLCFNENEYLLGFNNGVYDIEEDNFRPYKYNDYVTWSCGYDFEDLRDDKRLRELTKEDTDKFNTINTILTEIMPKVDNRKLLLTILSSGLVGKCIEKFFIFNGDGRNGKGLINEFMKSTIGDYMEYINVGVLTYQAKNTGGTNPELASMNLKRYIVMKEPDKTTPLLINVIKDMTGGGVLKGRQNYSNECNIKLCNTTGLECNDKPPLNESSGKASDKGRIIDLPFESSFVDKEENIDNANHKYLMNLLYKEDKWKRDHRVYFMNILLQHIQLLRAKNWNIQAFVPKLIADRTDTYINDSNDINKIFREYYERLEFNDEEGDAIIDIEDIINCQISRNINFITLKDISTIIKESNTMKLLPKHKQKELTSEVIKEYFKTNSIYKTFLIQRKKIDKKEYKNILVGYKFKNDDDDEEEIE